MLPGYKTNHFNPFARSLVRVEIANERSSSGFARSQLPHTKNHLLSNLTYLLQTNLWCNFYIRIDGTIEESAFTLERTMLAYIVGLWVSNGLRSLIDRCDEAMKWAKPADRLHWTNEAFWAFHTVGFVTTEVHKPLIQQCTSPRWRQRGWASSL